MDIQNSFKDALGTFATNISVVPFLKEGVLPVKNHLMEQFLHTPIGIHTIPLALFAYNVYRDVKEAPKEQDLSEKIWGSIKSQFSPAQAAYFSVMVGSALAHPLYAKEMGIVSEEFKSSVETMESVAFLPITAHLFKKMQAHSPNMALLGGATYLLSNALYLTSTVKQIGEEAFAGVFWAGILSAIGHSAASIFEKKDVENLQLIQQPAVTTMRVDLEEFPADHATVHIVEDLEDSDREEPTFESIDEYARTPSPTPLENALKRSRELLKNVAPPPPPLPPLPPLPAIPASGFKVLPPLPNINDGLVGSEQ